MNTPVKRTKFTALGKKRLTRAAVLLDTKKHLFHRKGDIAYRKDFTNIISSAENDCINMN